MPTIRGYKKGIDDAALKKMIDNYTARIVTIAAKAGKEAMKELRESAVKNWYSSTAQYAMHKATHYESDSPKQSKGKIEITIRSYVDIDEFENHKRIASSNNKYRSPYENVRRWRERHEKDGWRYYGKEQVHMNRDNLNKLGTYQPSRAALNMPYSIGEYLFRLPWEEGIVGLPPHERYTDTGWVNPKPNKDRDSLREYVNDYINKKWKKTVQEKFNKLMK